MRAAQFGPAILSMLLAAATLHAAEAPPAGRLPGDVAPTAYRLDLRIDPAQARFRGHVEIDTVWRHAGRSIYLHGNGLAVSSVSARAAGTDYPARYLQVDPLGVARLDFRSEVPAGPVTLTFDYTAALGANAEGLFRAKVGGDWYAWTQFEPIDARRMFPGFDEPGFKTPFTLSVTAPSADKVFANSPEAGEELQGRMATHRFAPTPPLPTYLLALAIGPFDVRGVSIAPNAVRREPLPFRVIGTRGSAAHMDIALAEAPKLLAMLEDYFGIPYPYDKLDFVACPIQMGAMENAGLILFDDGTILLDADATSAELGDFGNASAHEMAHQWVGDLVTPVWWNDLWLNESFAEWIGAKTAARWRPDLGVEASELADTYRAMDLDALGHGRPVHQDIASNAEITSAFDDITYQKGSQVLAMFEGYLGTETFAAGVRLHLQRHRNGNATADDFFAALAQAAGNDRIVPALRSFIDQTGVPVITVAYDRAGTMLSQSRYRALDAAAAGAAEPAQTWSIPLCLASAGNRLCTLLSAPSAHLAPIVDRADAAVVPNAGSVGYFRYRFAGDGWERLIARAASLPELEAMGLADSLWADFEAGHSSIERVIAGARALAGNPGSLAATALGKRLSRVAATMLEPSQMPGFRALMRSIYAPALTSIGFDPGVGAYANDPPARRELREALLALVALDGAEPGVRSRLVAAAKASLDGDAGALDPGFRRVAFAAAVREGGLGFLSRLRDVALGSHDAALRADAAWAIGLADTPPAAEAALALAVSPRLPTPEAMRLLMNLASQAESRETVLAYARDHFSELARLFPTFNRPEILHLFDGRCSGIDAERVEAFLAPRLTELGGGALELAQSKERIARCAALKSAKSGEFASAFSGG